MALQAQSGHRGPKNPKQSRNILTLSRLRVGHFEPQGPRERNSFWTLFATLGPKGSNDPFSRQKVVAMTLTYNPECAKPN